MKTKFLILTGISLASAMALAQSDGMPSGVNAAAEKSAMAPTAPTDAQIEKIVVTSNNVEIDMSKLAKDRAQNKDVKSMAKDMIKDHEKWNKDANALAKKIKTPPEDSDDSRQLTTEGQRIVDRLSGLKGVEFDKAYSEEGVKFHQNVLKAIDGKLLPSANNASLKKMLEETRPKVQAHLDHELRVQNEMKQ